MKIRIKKENRGKFTALKKRTGHSASWFKTHGTPAQRKMATFALNSRKWKHGDGGHLFDEGGETEEEYYPIWLDGITVKPSGNRPTTRDDWSWANWRDLQNEREQQAAESVRRGIDRADKIGPVIKGISDYLDTPIMVQANPGTATAYPSFGQYMPQVESTIGTEVGNLVNIMAAPTMLSDIKGLYNVGRAGYNIARNPVSWWRSTPEEWSLLTRMAGGTEPIVSGSSVAPRVAQAAKSTRMTPENTMSAYGFRDYMSNAEFRDAYNAFAKKYGYDEMPVGLSREKMNRMAQKAIADHNTFYRGVVYEGAAPEDIESVAQILGHEPTEEEFLRYAATHPRPTENAIFVSPSPNLASMYGKTARVERPYTLGDNRMNWFNEGEYTIGGNNSGADLINPWVSKYSPNARPTELLLPEGVFRGWVDTTPKITAENAASITPKQWTAAQDAAIARGDMTEAQRLRDLHSTLTPTATPGKYYRGTKTKRNSYIDRHVDEEVGEMNGIYMTKKPKYAKTYGDVEEFYLHSNNPLETEGNWTGVINDATRAEIENAGYDAIVNNKFDTGFLNRLLRNSRDETITFSGKNIKSADAVTYDNNGVRIPLGERDNFSISDIRYSLLPWIFGGGTGIVGYGYLNQNEGPLIGMAMGGRLRR